MSKPVISFFSQDEIEVIHNASLDVLGSTGIRVMSAKALGILKEAGAKVDYERSHAIISRNLVEEALVRAPKAIKICARNPEYDLALDKQDPCFTTDGGAPFITDFETGERRISTGEDLAKWTRIADYLDNVHIIWPSVTAGDVAAPMQEIIRDDYLSEEFGEARYGRIIECCRSSLPN